MKRIITLVLAMVIVLGAGATSFAATPAKAQFKEKMLEFRAEDINTKIEEIVNLEIIQGTENGLELERGLTRAEGATVYTKLFGAMPKAMELSKENSGYKTKFTDIPQWATVFVNYLYKQNLIFGVSDTKFGSNDLMTAEQFTTMVLRGLGYSDKNGEFVWNKSLEKAVDIGLLSDSEKALIEKDKLFTREEMILISYNSLFTENKLTGYLLISERSQGDDGITHIIHDKLTQEEITELEKTKTNQKYKLFADNKEKQTALNKKVKSVIQDSIDMYTITVQGKPVKFDVQEVYQMYLNTFGGVTVIFNSGFVTNIRLTEGVITNEGDTWLAEDLMYSFLSDIGYEQYNIESTWVKFEKSDKPSNNIKAAEVFDSSTEKYKFSATPTEVDMKILKFNIKTFTK